jgi:hypothetical protein
MATKAELEQRIAALEAQVALLAAQVAQQQSPIPPLQPYHDRQWWQAPAIAPTITCDTSATIGDVERATKRAARVARLAVIA